MTELSTELSRALIYFAVGFSAFTLAFLATRAFREASKDARDRYLRGDRDERLTFFQKGVLILLAVIAFNGLAPAFEPLFRIMLRGAP